MPSGQSTLTTGAVSTIVGPASSGGGNYTDSSNPANVTFDNPASLTTDGTYLYFVDNGNIRRTDPATGATTTVCGTSTAVGVLHCVTDGADGNLYVPPPTSYGYLWAVLQLNPTTLAWTVEDNWSIPRGSVQITANSADVYFRAGSAID